MPDEREMQKESNKVNRREDGSAFSSGIARKMQRLLNYLQARAFDLTRLKSDIGLPRWRPDYSLFANTEWSYSLIARVSKLVDSLHSLLNLAPTLSIEQSPLIWYRPRRKNLGELPDMTDVTTQADTGLQAMDKDVTSFDTEYIGIDITEPKSMQTVAADNTGSNQHAAKMRNAQHRLPFRRIENMTRRLPDIRLISTKPIKTAHRDTGLDGQFIPQSDTDISSYIIDIAPYFETEEITAGERSIYSRIPRTFEDYIEKREAGRRISRLQPPAGLPVVSHTKQGERQRISEFVNDAFNPSSNKLRNRNEITMPHPVTERKIEPLPTIGIGYVDHIIDDEMLKQQPASLFQQEREMIPLVGKTAAIRPSRNVSTDYPFVPKALLYLNMQQPASERLEQNLVRSIAQNLIYPHPHFGRPLFESDRNDASPFYPDIGSPMVTERGSSPLAMSGIDHSNSGAHKELALAPLGRSKESSPAEETNTETAVEAHSDKNMEPDIDKLAHDVYTHLKRRLAWEKEYSLVR